MKYHAQFISSTLYIADICRSALTTVYIIDIIDVQTHLEGQASMTLGPVQMSKKTEV